MDVSRLPRLTPVPYGDSQGNTRDVYDYLNLPPDERDSDVMTTFMLNPELQKILAPVTRYVRDSTCLPVHDREVAILRNAWNCGADYQWVAHTHIGLECGLTREEIDRVADRPDAAEWTASQRAILRAADELHATCRIGDETWALLAEHYDSRQLIEVLALFGIYRTLAYVMNAVGIRPPRNELVDVPGGRFLFSGQ